MTINNVNTDHGHAAVDLPTRPCIEEMMQLLKAHFTLLKVKYLA